MSVEQLLKLLGPSRVATVERAGDALLLRPPESKAAVRVSRERFTRLSTELAWVFTASAECDAGFEGVASIEQEGFLRKRWTLKFSAPESSRLREVLGTLLSSDLRDLLRKAKPERVAIEVGNSVVRVQVVKTLTGPLATPLVHCYDFSIKTATILSELLSKKKENLS